MARQLGGHRFTTITKVNTDDGNVSHDRLNGYPVFQNNIHNKIHEGIQFCRTGQEDLDDEESKDFILTTPNTPVWCHLQVDNMIRATDEGFFKLFEASSVSAQTSITAFNRNRNVNTTPLVSITDSPTIVVTGTLIYEEHFGGGAKKGDSEGTGAREWILKQNEVYLLRYVSEASANEISYDLCWYEQENI